MGYCTLQHIEWVIAQAVTTASPSDVDAPVDLLRIGNTFDTNSIPIRIVEQYISWADEKINSYLSELYVTPFCELADFETPLLADINEYNPYIITCKRCPFNIGDVVILIDGDIQERHIIEEIINDTERNVFATEDVIVNNFSADTTRLIRVKFPEPINLMSARLSAANIYDKYFASQSDPNESQFGKYLRTLVRQSINNILSGRTILHGQHRIGRRFFSSTLVGRYGLPEPVGSESDIDDLGRV